LIALRVFAGIFAIVLILTGCGSSTPESKPNYQTEYIMFNARNVSNDMLMEIVHNSATDYNDSIKYTEQDSHKISWFEEDSITLKYSQDENFNISYPETKIKGKKLVCAIGNAAQATPPILVTAPESDDIPQGRAYIRVINAMNDGIEKRIDVNNIVRSNYTIFASISDDFNINNPTAKSLVYVQYKDGTEFLFQEIDFAANHAYYIIIYENKRSPDEPGIAIIDMTP